MNDEEQESNLAAEPATVDRSQINQTRNDYGPFLQRLCYQQRKSKFYFMVKISAASETTQVSEGRVGRGGAALLLLYGELLNRKLSLLAHLHE